MSSAIHQFYSRRRCWWREGRWYTIIRQTPRAPPPPPESQWSRERNPGQQCVSYHVLESPPVLSHLRHSHSYVLWITKVSVHKGVTYRFMLHSLVWEMRKTMCLAYFTKDPEPNDSSDLYWERTWPTSEYTSSLLSKQCNTKNATFAHWPQITCVCISHAFIHPNSCLLTERFLMDTKQNYYRTNTFNIQHLQNIQWAN